MASGLNFDASMWRSLWSGMLRNYLINELTGRRGDVRELVSRGGLPVPALLA